MSKKSKSKAKPKPRTSAVTAMTAQAPMPKAAPHQVAAAPKPLGATASMSMMSTKGPRHRIAELGPHAELRSQVVHAPVHRKAPPPNHK